MFLFDSIKFVCQTCHKERLKRASALLHIINEELSETVEKTDYYC